ncbi:hypothetical protein LCGC14_1372390 [marine sediment metagenome]|uniref:Phage protein GP46 n=1 Tax=marine sediment metagenome TaxID=412755 RepID=A0A0F9KR08_9ZZZZ
MATVVDDIRIIWDAGLQEGDFNFLEENQDLESDNGLETAVIISLFTDRRAKVDDILPDPNNPDRRGWWGDLVSPEVKDDQIGSRLWLLNREKTLESVLERAKQYAEEALQWLIEDGVAVKIDVETERQGIPGQDRLALGVMIHKKDGKNVALNFEAQWIAQGLRG